MFSSFDWEFEEDERPPRQPDQGSPPPLWRRPWPRRLAVLAILIAILGLSARAWLNVRRQVISEAEAQLRAAVQLELETIAAGDDELFRSRQDPRDPIWQDQQVSRYFSAASAPFVPVPGLELAPRPSEIGQVDLVGRTARVELIHWFQVSPAQPTGSQTNQPANQPTPPLPFQVTWSYRQATDGTWFHVAPLDDDWRVPYFNSAGTRTTQSPSRESVVIGFTLSEAKRLLRVPALDDGSLVVVAAPSWFGPVLQIQATQAEAQLLDPLTSRLGDLIARGCDWLHCPSDAHFTLSFEDLPGPRLQGARWALPSLYLTGLPASAEAAAAWSHALELWMVETLARSQLDDQRLTGRLIYRQLVRRLQAELDLTPPLSADVDLLAQAVLAGQQHTPEYLWAATYDPDDLPATHLLEAEIAAFLDLLAERVGSQHLGALLTVLNASSPPDDAALFDLYELDRDEFTAAWYNYLSQLTGQAILPLSIFAIIPAVGEPLGPPPLQPPPPLLPGDQIALVCDGRLWVGDADGQDLFPVTPAGHRFSAPRWSPDGSWLLSSWFHSPAGPFSALYLLAADGDQARLLTDDPATKVSFLTNISWSPSNPDRLIFKWRTDETQSARYESFLFDLGAGPLYSTTNARRAAWSPDGAWVAFIGGDVMTIVDQDGRERFTLELPGSCSDLAWNPAADLSGLDRRFGAPSSGDAQ